jgi:hypothetical protein
MIRLKDRITRLRSSRRLDKAQRGNLGDVKPVGESVFEMRGHFGVRLFAVQQKLTMALVRAVSTEPPNACLEGNSLIFSLHPSRQMIIVAACKTATFIHIHLGIHIHEPYFPPAGS